MSLAESLLEKSERLTFLMRKDGLPCPPVPPNQFHLRVVSYRLTEIERALERCHFVTLKIPGKTLPEVIYSKLWSIYWIVLGKPPPRVKDYLHASEMLMRVLCNALEQAFNAAEASKPTM